MSKTFDYSYELYSEGIDQLTKDIKASKIQFSYIVGIARGGAIPAIQLSHRLSLPIQIIHWSTYGSKSFLAVGNDVDSRIKRDLSVGKKILVVEDIIDRGNTISQLRQSWTAGSFFNHISLTGLKVACLVFNKDNEVGVQADFHHIKYPGKFVNFWWEGTKCTTQRKTTDKKEDLVAASDNQKQYTATAALFTDTQSE